VVEQRPKQLATLRILFIGLVRVTHQLVPIMPQQIGNRLNGQLALAFLEAGLFPQQQRLDKIGHAAIAGGRLRLNEYRNVGPDRMVKALRM
jgi:hypothetical protein